MATKLVIGLIFIIAMVTFAATNNADVELKYYFGHHYDLKLWVLVLSSLGVGFLIAGAGWLITFMKLSARSALLSSKVTALDKQVKEFQQKPWPDEPTVYPSPKKAETVQKTSMVKTRLLTPVQTPLLNSGDQK